MLISFCRIRLIGRCDAVAAVLGAALFVASAPALAAQTYYIDEDTNYSNGNSCDIQTVNTITASLQTQLNTDGWSGLRYTEFSAWPQDFWEESSSVYGTDGDDNLYGDSRSFSVMAGHGSAHTIYFSSTGNGGTYNGSSQCYTSFANNAQMGKLAGGQAAFGMWLECSVIQIAELPSYTYWAQHKMRQIASWRNTISIGDDEPLDFYNATASATNVNAWGNQMSSDGRQAIVATFSDVGSTDCWNVHDSAQLKKNSYTYPLAGNSVYYCYTTWN
jgi:hypothetical protein